MVMPTTIEALNIIKNVLDVASKSGMFENLESAVAVNNAFIVLSNTINKPIEQKDLCLTITPD